MKPTDTETQQEARYRARNYLEEPTLSAFYFAKESVAKYMHSTYKGAG